MQDGRMDFFKRTVFGILTMGDDNETNPACHAAVRSGHRADRHPAGLAGVVDRTRKKGDPPPNGRLFYWSM